MATPNRVQPGQPLIIPAALWNDLMGLLQAGRAGRTAAGGGQGAAPFGTVILVRNDSEVNIDRFGVLAIIGPVFGPAASESGFTDSGCLAAFVPSAEYVQQFVVVQEPILAGAVGRAVISGFTIARVNLHGPRWPGGPVDGWAIAAEGLTVLQSAPSGAAQILWSEALAEEEDYPIEKWALVRLGIQPPAMTDTFPAKVTAEDSPGLYAWVEQHVAIDGDFFEPTFPRTSGALGLAREFNDAQGLFAGEGSGSPPYYVQLFEFTDAAGAKWYRFYAHRGLTAGGEAFITSIRVTDPNPPYGPGVWYKYRQIAFRDGVCVGIGAQSDWIAAV
jgi:hypothetical protein